MITVYSLTESEKKNLFIKKFIAFPKKLYRNESNWIPWFDLDMKNILNRKHPFFLHSEGEFFLAEKEGAVCGRICVVSNTHYQEEHSRRCAHFFFLDAEEDSEIFSALLSAASAWAASRGLETLDGPLLFGATCGSGILVEGYDIPAPMTMMPYNYPYYKTILEQLGFEKLFDTIGTDISPDKFDVPEKVKKLAEKVIARERFKVLKFKSKKELLKIADDIADLYNETLGDHPEDYPLTPEELDQLKNDLMTVASPDLIKILQYDGRIVGYLLAFPDMSAVLRKNGGRITPLGIIRLLWSMKHTEKVLFNGMGILPEYQRLGGNALLYYELSKTVRSRKFRIAETVQIAETTELMLSDIKQLGSVVTKIHRIYTAPLDRFR